MPHLIESHRKRKNLTLGLVYLFLTGVAMVILFPYVWMGLTSFKPIEEFFTYPLKWFTQNWTLGQYAGVLED